MRIAVVGAGAVGAALGRGWTRAGHAVTFGLRAPESGKHAALLAETGALSALPATAAADAGAVVLALPWTAAEAVVTALGDLEGKLVIDCMNPLAMTGAGLGLDRGFSTSGGETVAKWLPRAHVVKTLNQVGAEVMADTRGFAHPPVMFVAGDEAGDEAGTGAGAKALAMGLVRDLGFEALDAGDLAMARLLEPLAMVWINQAMFRGQGRNWAFAALPLPAHLRGERQ